MTDQIQDTELRVAPEFVVATDEAEAADPTSNLPEDEVYGKVIYAYTASQAVEDGYLVPLSDMDLAIMAELEEAGNQVKIDDWKRESLADMIRVNVKNGRGGQLHPVFNFAKVLFTRALWEIVEKAVHNERHYNDYKGVIWDIVWLASIAIYRNPRQNWSQFRVTITGAGRKRNFWIETNLEGYSTNPEDGEALIFKLS